MHRVLLGVLLAMAGVVAAQSGAAVAPPRSQVIDSAQLMADLRALSTDALEGRQTRSAGAAAARKLIVERFRQVGLEPVGDAFERPYASAGRSAAGEAGGVNVVGRLSGTRSPARFLVVSAHYDHVGIENGRVFNGANDNASGVAALSAVASYFARARPATSILFVAFDSEEDGLRGSRAFVRDPPVPREAIVANVNLDMIGRDVSETLWAAGARRFPVFDPIIARVAKDAPARLRAGHDDPAAREDWSRMSDNLAFIEAGIPALLLSVEDYRYWHAHDDEFESMMPEFYVRTVETIIRLIDAIDRDADTVAKARTNPR